MEFASEKEFEDAVIRLLVNRGWKEEIIAYPTEEQLIKNWADILFNNNQSSNALNGCPLTDSEMQQILDQVYAKSSPVELNDFINGKSVSIKRDNPKDKLNLGKEVSLHIYDRNEIAGGKSVYQIVRQPRFKASNAIFPPRRGDLMLLVNGMPVIHIELKKNRIPVSQAYSQIEKYAHEGIFTGIFSLIQVFVAMTPEETVYFANPGKDGDFGKSYRFHWADFDNVRKDDWGSVVSDLLNIPMAHKLIGFYTIADGKDGCLKVLRSYQYYAAERIAGEVERKDWDDGNLLGGFVWHTTGSGKTMTSFKSAQLIKNSGAADKVIFVVDRKTLAKQSYDDYNDFAGNLETVQKTRNSSALIAKLKSDDPDDALIVTSIQKMSNLAEEKGHARPEDIKRINEKRIVIIIDEAHRDTFGDMLRNIKDTFKRAILFGFTGTPILEENKKKDNTTTTVFGNELHRYTLADGIRDGNVLGFDPYMEKLYDDDEIREEVAIRKSRAKDRADALASKKKAKIYNHYMNPSEVTMEEIENEIPSSQYEEDDYRNRIIQSITKKWGMLSRNGKFHAIFATSKIQEAVIYYRLIKEIAPHLSVTAVFDPSTDDGGSGSLAKEDGIAEILSDYNKRFGKSFSMQAGDYDRFRADVQSRLAHKKPYRNINRKQQLDILIVVNQMLTGYDSKWVNTLYLDKVLEYEHLIQAFSRTNRLFGEEKPFGIIKYFRKPHTMYKNIMIAVKAYSGDIPTGFFVNKLPQNLRNMNRVFGEIKELFEGAGISDFERLPEEKSEKAKFAKLFKHLNEYLEAAEIQGFRWSKSEYGEKDGCGIEPIKMEFDETIYLTLAQRYKELFSGRGGGGGFSDVPFEIDTHLTEIRTDTIDADFMDSRFKKYQKLMHQQDADPAAVEASLRDLHKSYAMLSSEEQKYARIVIRDFQSGELKDLTVSFRQYISEYMKRAENDRIGKVVASLGCDEGKLRELLALNVNETTINEFGRFDDLVKSVDKQTARKFFVKELKQDFVEYKLQMNIHNYLRDFVLSGGKNTAGESYAKQPKNTNSSTTSAGSNEPPEDKDLPDAKAVNTVKSDTLKKWYKKSNAVPSLMKTGCVAYVEGRLCVFDSKYIERTPSGSLRLTTYAKEHEDECFLQFILDSEGDLRYIKLPPEKADKKFRYYEHIDEEIAKRCRLVSEIGNAMLDEIRHLEFGKALKKLMSKKICGVSMDLLQSITGLDKRTISDMQRNAAINHRNAVSAFLGIHIPFKVSDSMLKKEGLSVDVQSDSDKIGTYFQLLTMRWASDYDDIYEDMKNEGLEELITTPPGTKRSVKRGRRKKS